MALLYILTKYKEEDKKSKSFLLTYPIIVFIIIWNPIFTKIILNFINEEVYWRMYWLVPIGITLAYIFTKIIYSQSKVIRKIFNSIAIFIIIIASGKLVFSSENYQKVNNYYKVPDEILDIVLEVSKDEEGYKKLVGPHEFIIYTRQIDGTIKLGDARSFTAVYSQYAFVTFINEGDVSNLMVRAKKEDCNYIVFKNETELNSDPEIYGYKLIKQNKLYKLYKFE